MIIRFVKTRPPNDKKWVETENNILWVKDMIAFLSLEACVMKLLTNQS